MSLISSLITARRPYTDSEDDPEIVYDDLETVDDYENMIAEEIEEAVDDLLEKYDIPWSDLKRIILEVINE